MNLRKQELDIIQQELALEAERLQLCKDMDALSESVNNIYAQRKTSPLTAEEWSVVADYWTMRSQYTPKLKALREKFAALANGRKAIHAQRGKHKDKIEQYGF